MKFKINKKFQLQGNEGDSRTALKWFVIAHESGNQADTKDINAVAHEAQYMHNNYESAYTTHFVGGGGQIYQIGKPGYISWGALDGNPYAVAQVELARTKDKKVFEKDYQAYIYILRTMALKYGIPLTLDKGDRSTKGIKTHDWITKVYGGSHDDPIGYLQRWGISQHQFAKDLKTGLNGLLDKHQAKKYINHKYNSENYYQFNPVLVQTTKKLGSFRLADLDKNSFDQHIKTGEILRVSEIKKIGSVSRLHTDKGWISGRRDFVAPYYYTNHDEINRVQILVHNLRQYQDANLSQKNEILGKGIYNIIQTKETSTNKFALQLQNHLWISARKDLVKKLR